MAVRLVLLEWFGGRIWDGDGWGGELGLVVLGGVEVS